MGNVGIPLYGQNKAGGDLQKLTDSVKVLRFKVTATTAAIATSVLHGFAAGDMILGFNLKVTTAVTSSGSATVLFGFTGGTHVTGAIAKATLVDNYVVGSADKGATVLLAADNFDITVGTAALTAGAFDIQIVYVPAANITDGTNEENYRSLDISA
jgi:hypothetical protein